MSKKNLRQMLLFLCFFVGGCASSALWLRLNANQPSHNRASPAAPPWIPIYPTQLIAGKQGVIVQLAVPITTPGDALTLIEFRSPTDYGYVTRAEQIFPTDIYIAVLPEVGLPKVFLARSPQSGCLVEWQPEVDRFKANCDGSEFGVDGAYLSGPAARNLDEFPVTVDAGMLWITNTVTLGGPVVSTTNQINP